MFKVNCHLDFNFIKVKTWKIKFLKNINDETQGKLNLLRILNKKNKEN